MSGWKESEWTSLRIVAFALLLGGALIVGVMAARGDLGPNVQEGFRMFWGYR